MTNQKLTVQSSITESYRFFVTHIPHFLRLIYGPLTLWVMIKIAEQILFIDYNISINFSYIFPIITGAFAVVWYRQFLLGTRYASYRLLFKQGFNGGPFTWRRLYLAAIRIIVISLALLVPTLIISTSMMVYYQGQGVLFSENLIHQLATRSTFVVMLIFSPIFVRLSLYTAGLALGRTSLGFKDVWAHTRGYTVTLWWMALRAFLPLSIYSYVMTFLLQKLAKKLSINYILSTFFIEALAGFLTFMMLAIVVAANAEAFRVLVGIRDHDSPHRSNHLTKANRDFIQK